MPRNGKREFDRRSGSDKSSVKPFEKREGGGAHNWGTVDDELKASAEENEWQPEENTEQRDSTATEEKPKTEPSESKPDDGGENGTVEVVEEEPAPVMTLDEYRAMKEKTRAKVELNHRKVDGKEGWKNAVELKKEETEFFSGTRVSARLTARTHECSKCTI